MGDAGAETVVTTPLHRRPLGTYAEPRFPVADALYLEPYPGALARFVATRTMRALALTGVLPLVAPACTTDGNLPRRQGYYFNLTEAEARTAILGAFTREGVTLTEDVPISRPGVHFTADGFSDQPAVGFEYMSTEDGDTGDLTDAEIAAVDHWRTEDGPYFLILREADYQYSLESERVTRLDELRQRVVDFVAGLKAQGVI